MNSKLATLQFSVSHNKLTLTQDLIATTGLINTMQAHFTFDINSEWSDLTSVIATFQYGAVAKAIQLDTDGYCVLPWEVLVAQPNGNQYYEVGLIGMISTPSVMRMTTNKVKCKVNQSISLSGTAPSTPTPDIFTQIYDYINSKPHFTAAQITSMISSYLEENEYATEGYVDSAVSTHNTATTSHSALFAEKQNVTDNNLNTTSKTVVGAINEVKASVPSITLITNTEIEELWS